MKYDDLRNKPSSKLKTLTFIKRVTGGADPPALVRVSDHLSIVTEDPPALQQDEIYIYRDLQNYLTFK